MSGAQSKPSSNPTAPSCSPTTARRRDLALPASNVRCELQNLADGPALVATELAD